MNRLLGFSCFLLLCVPTLLAAPQTERERADAYFFDQPPSTGTDTGAGKCKKGALS